MVLSLIGIQCIETPTGTILFVNSELGDALLVTWSAESLFLYLFSAFLVDVTYEKQTARPQNNTDF